MSKPQHVPSDIMLIARMARSLRDNKIDCDDETAVIRWLMTQFGHYDVALHSEEAATISKTLKD